MQQFVGIDWATRRARWCGVTSTGAVIDEGWAPADEDGLAGLVMRLGPEASACMEMMSGAAWVRERLQAAGWTVQIADARKAKAVASLAAKTDKLDARVLAELARRDLVPQVHVPTFADRELKERLGRRMHMVRLRTAAINRAHGVLSQFGVRLGFDRLRAPDAQELLIERACRRSGGARSPRPLRSRTCSTSVWSRSSRSCDRWRAPTNASGCWSRSPGSAICSD